MSGHRICGKPIPGMNVAKFWCGLDPGHRGTCVTPLGDRRSEGTDSSVDQRLLRIERALSRLIDMVGAR